MPSATQEGEVAGSSSTNRLAPLSPSTDQTIGTDTASLNGSRYEWSIGQPGAYGRLYA